MPVFEQPTDSFTDNSNLDKTQLLDVAEETKLDLIDTDLEELSLDPIIAAQPMPADAEDIAVNAYQEQELLSQIG